MIVKADVLMAREIPADEVAWIVGAFASVGVTADLRIAGPRRSFGTVGWLILAALPLQPFFSQLADDFADDVYEQLKTFVSRLLHRKHADTEDRPRRVLVLQDTATGVQVVLEPDLSAESIRQLMSFDLTTIRHGPLHYDAQQRRWRSELDEQRQEIPPAPDETGDSDLAETGRPERTSAPSPPRGPAGRRRAAR